jgi:hypothetical protein
MQQPVRNWRECGTQQEEKNCYVEAGNSQLTVFRQQHKTENTDRIDRCIRTQTRK